MFSFKRLQLKWFQLWWSIGWGWVILVWYLSLISHPLDIDVGTSFNDKIGHMLAYGWLMFWFGNLYYCRHGRTSYLLIFIIMGVVLEGIQSLNPTRMFEFGDMLANAIGAGIGFLLTINKGRYMLQKLEKRLTNFV